MGVGAARGGECPCLFTILWPGREGLRPGQGWGGLEGSGRGMGKEGAAQMTADDSEPKLLPLHQRRGARGDDEAWQPLPQLLWV